MPQRRPGCGLGLQILWQLGKPELLLRRLEEYRIDLAALSEVRWKEEDAESLAEGKWTFLHTASTPTGSGGVGIMFQGKVQSSWKENGEDWSVHGHRILRARMKHQSGFTTILAVYAPTDEHQEETDSFYDELQRVVSNIHRRDVLLQLGDLNARVGVNNDGFESVMGIHGLKEKTNTNGDKLRQFCLLNDLVIQGTRFPHREIHKGTWVHPASKVRHQIDHIITNRRFRSAIEDVRVCRGAYIGSDHLMVLAKAKLHSLRHSKSQKIDMWSFCRMNPDQCHEYEAAVAGALREEVPDGTVEGKWKRIKGVVQRKMNEKARENRRQRRVEWLSEDTLQLVEKKRNIFLQLQERRSSEAQAETQLKYTQLNKEVKQAVRRDKKEWLEHIAQTMETAAKHGRTHG